MTNTDSSPDTAPASNDPLVQTIESRLQSSALTVRQQALVRAALKGSEALGSQLLGEVVESVRSSAPDAVIARDVFLRSLTVEGFRGIGPSSTLDLEPGPGLTLVVGRNGSGKSSFADGLEMLLTGETWRWLKKSKVWTSGWRNLHQPTGASVSAEFIAETVPSPIAGTIVWNDGSDLGAGERFSQPRGKQRQPMSALGWEDYVDTARPFLSYSELGGLLDVGPTKLYDSLSRILGLDRLVNATENLRQERLNRNKAHKNLKASLTDHVLPRLRVSGDDRARKCETALQAQPWDLDTAHGLVEPSAATGEPNDLANLRRLAGIEVPDQATVDGFVKQLHELEEQRAAQSSTDAGRSAQVANLLSKALVHFEDHGDGDCPVCGNVDAIDPSWATAAREQLADLEEKARRYRETETAIRDVMRAVRDLPAAANVDADVLPQLLGDAAAGTVPGLLEEWNQALLSDDHVDAAAQLESAVEPAIDALQRIKDAANAEVERREDAWRPVAMDVRLWISEARQVLAEFSVIPEIRSAEDWLRIVADEIRAGRFRPISQQSQKIWSKLNLQSNVHVSDVVLTGKATARRVDIQVDVDGVEGVALGVMSQGELHSLVLSLFLPRACLDESPFRFIVIDDPVQAMDPARVDGLATVLNEIADDRQVIVFTHDDRLPEAVRRLQIPARITEVHRRPGSVIELRKSQDPVGQALSDAWAISRSSGVPDVVRGRVVAGFCRSALEAACVESVRRNWLSSGRTHADVEEAVRNATRLTHYVSLALFDDLERGGDVLPTINQRWGYPAGNAFQACNRGIHGEYDGDLGKLVNECQSLAERIRRL